MQRKAAAKKGKSDLSLVSPSAPRCCTSRQNPPWPKTREQRCWVHETTNVRKRAAKEPARQGKRTLQAIWMVETKAEAAFDAFIETYAVKY
jgi:hypothetical protein